MTVTALTESWFGNVLIPVLQDYIEQGAKSKGDLVRMAMKDRQETIADYLQDIDAREWKDIQKYVGRLREQTTSAMIGGGIAVTKGMANAMAKGPVYRTCSNCGLTVPRYQGAYPKKCPQCGAMFNTPKESLEALKIMSKIIINESEDTDIRYLGTLGNYVYVMLQEREYAFVPKSMSAEEIGLRLEKLIFTEPARALGYLMKNAVAVEEGRAIAKNYKATTVEEQIVKNRVLYTITESELTNSFWGSKDGKKIVKEQKVKLKDLEEGEILLVVEESQKSLMDTSLEINSKKLLEFLQDISYNDEARTTVVFIDRKAMQENIEGVYNTLLSKYPESKMLDYSDKSWVLAVYK